MNAPRRAQIGAHIIKIIPRMNLTHEGKECYGLAGQENGVCEIELTMNMDEARCGSVLMHEFIETAKDTYDLRLNHTTVTTLAEAMYQMLSSSGLLRPCHTKAGKP